MSPRATLVSTSRGMLCGGFFSSLQCRMLEEVQVRGSGLLLGAGALVLQCLPDINPSPVKRDHCVQMITISHGHDFPLCHVSIITLNR